MLERPLLLRPNAVDQRQLLFLGELGRPLQDVPQLLLERTALQLGFQLQRRHHLVVQLAHDHLGHDHILNAGLIAQGGRPALPAAGTERSVIGLSKVVA